MTFDVSAGEVFGFLGPNGAGKTTTVRVLSTLVRPTSGTAEVAGMPVSEETGPELRSRIAVMTETPGLYLRLTVFDNLEYKVEGYKVTLVGQVTNPTLKSDAENVVKHIEGVEQVDNRIEVLPTSPMDDNLRLKMYAAIYGYSALQKYAMPVVKPIRIIVKSGHATLEGVVDSEADKNLAGLRANSVPGVFSVTNNLRVAKD